MLQMLSLNWHTGIWQSLASEEPSTTGEYTQAKVHVEAAVKSAALR
jgi:hypothetical protein